MPPRPSRVSPVTLSIPPRRTPLPTYPADMFDDIDNVMTAMLLGMVAILPWLTQVTQLSQR